jgi:hypothetical protein
MRFKEDSERDEKKGRGGNRAVEEGRKKGET